MLDWFWWLVLVVVWVIFILLTMSLARGKGRSPLVWALLACFFPLITVIVLLLIPPARRY